MAKSHFVVLRQEQIGALSAGLGCVELEEAIKVATEKTEGDKEPRYVVQLLRQISVDPKPRVIVTDLAEVSNA